MKANFTIEVAYIMPIILLVLMLSTYTAFYFHDKNIIYGTAYEAAVLGSTLSRSEELDVAAVESLFIDKLEQKLLFLELLDIRCTSEGEIFRVTIQAGKSRWKVKVEQEMPIVLLEAEVRDKRRFIEG